jgi:multidrug efflux pump subunit AcrB
VQFRIVGEDVTTLRQFAEEAKALMRAHPDMTGINDNWNESVKAVRLEIDQEKARALGVSERTLYRLLRDWEKNAAAKGPAQG